MSVLMEVLAELWSMFVGDRRLTLFLLAVVAIAAVVSLVFGDRLLAGGLLLAGALAVLTDSVIQAARRARGASPH